MQHINFRKIEQFRQVVRDAPKGVLDFTGTVKLHGTNAAVVIRKDGTYYAQSRNNVITVENDNAGFAKFAQEEKEQFLLATEHLEADELAVFGEWCGSGIQKGVGISELPKMFVVFAVKSDGVWVPREDWIGQLSKLFTGEQRRVFNVYEFPHFQLSIDFNKPEEAQNKLVEITEAVEKRCPVAKHFGVDGVGEGVVWSNHETGLMFKVKGEKHSVTRVKTLAAVDTEKLNGIYSFLDYALTENRLMQARTEVTPDMDVKKLGDFIRWVYNDITVEEADTMLENGIDAKDLGKHVSTRARTWFFNNQ